MDRTAAHSAVPRGDLRRSLFLCLVLGVFTAQPARAVVVSHVVAYAGQVAPGTNGATFSFVWPGAINADGNIVFRATLTGTGINSGNNEGVWVYRNGVVSLLVQNSNASPVPGEPFRVRGEPNINDRGNLQRGRVALQGSLTNSGNTVRLSQQNDTDTVALFSLRAREGTAAPGGGGSLFGPLYSGAQAEHPLYNNADETAFAAVLAVVNQTGIWFDDHGTDLQLVTRQGQQAPGVGGTTPFSTLSAPLLNDAGTLVFLADLNTTSGTPFLRDSLWLAPRGMPGLLLDSLQNTLGLPMGTETSPGGTLSINSAGQVAYQVSIVGNSGITSGISVAPGRSGLVRQDRDGVNPGPRMLLLESGDLVFIGDSIPGGLSGLYYTDGGLVTPAFAEGGAAPDLPAGVQLFKFENIEANRDGQVGFQASLSGTGVTSANNKAIWRSGREFPTEIVARKGDTLTGVSGTVNFIALTEVGRNGGNGADGQRRKISQDGEMLWYASTTASNSVVMVTGPGVPPQPLTRLVGLEAVQVIQDWSSTVPLIENKDTIVRAHFQRSVPTTIQPRLRGFRGGVELANSPLAANNPGARVPVPENASSLRSSGSQVALFDLPPDWNHGTVRFEVELSDGSELICREFAPPTSSDCELTVTFSTSVTPKIHFVTMEYKTGNTNHYVDISETKDLVNRLVSAYPSTAVDWNWSIGNWPGGTPPEALSKPTRDASFQKVLVQLLTKRAANGCSSDAGCKDIYYATIEGESLEGLANGIPSDVALGFVRTDPLQPGRHTHSHEIGHTLGQPHATRGDRDFDGVLDLINGSTQKQGYCGEVAAVSSPDFPFIDIINGARKPTLGPNKGGENAIVWGFDSLQRRIVSPFADFAMMSYCASSPIDFWPSRDSYVFIKQAIADRFGAGAPVPPGPSQNFALYRGVIDFALDTIELQPLQLALDVPQPDNPVTGEFSIVLKNSGGGTLSTTAFKAQKSEGRGGTTDLGSFVVARPFDANVRQVEVKRNGVLKAQRVASANAPVVNITAPAGGSVLNQETATFAWTGSDQDGDALSYMLQYSADDGSTWTTLLTDIAEQSVEVPRISLAGSANARIRVLVSDGFNVSWDVSDAFTVANSAPVVVITSPADETLLIYNQMLHLKAGAFDTEDGVLAESAVSWSSSVDGSLGTGANLSLPVSDLSAGTHQLTATATDSDAATGTASVEITVMVNAPATLADLAVVWAESEGVLLQAQGTEAQLTLTNNGPEAATSVTVSFLATGTSIASIQAGAGWNCLAGVCSAATLGLDAQADFVVSYTAGPAAHLEISATAHATTTDPLGSNNSGTQYQTVSGTSELLFKNGFE